MASEAWFVLLPGYKATSKVASRLGVPLRHAHEATLLAV